MYATFLRAAFGTRRRAWAVIVAWVLLVGILGAMSPSIDEVKAAGNDGAPADAAAVTDHFRGSVGERTLAPISASCAEPGSGLRPGADCMPAGVEGPQSGDGLTAR